MTYTIETKQTKTLSGIKFCRKEDVINSIKMFDLKPDFRIMDEQNNDVTVEFVSLLEKDGYQFIDINKVVKKLPSALQDIMNMYYKSPLTLSDLNNTIIQLVTVRDIKSIKGFYELWDAKGISIGSSAEEIVFFDISSGSIYKILKDSLNNIKDNKCYVSTVDEFVKHFQESAT